MKATRLLTDEHKVILRALYILEQMAMCAERLEPISASDVEDILQFLNAFANNHHQGKEEAILFPAMLTASQGHEKDALHQMIVEHDQERATVASLEEAVRANNGKEFADYARRLVDILGTHIYKEDHILFELADKVLSETSDVRTARELEEYGRVWRETALEKLLVRLHRLEWKYLGKTAGITRARNA